MSDGDALRLAIAFSMLIFLATFFRLVMARRYLPLDEATRLKYLGPSIIISGSIAGPGEIILTSTLGGWSLWVFGVGAFFILFSTSLSGVSGGGRVIPDYLIEIGFSPGSNLALRKAWTRGYLICVRNRPPAGSCR